MRLYQSLGSEQIELYLEDMWDFDEEDFSAHGEAIMNFIRANEGSFSVDFGDSPECGYLTHFFMVAVNIAGTQHHPPYTKKFWEDIAQILTKMEVLVPKGTKTSLPLPVRELSTYFITFRI